MRIDRTTPRSESHITRSSQCVFSQSSWSSEPKQFVVEARLEDGWKTVNVENGAETDRAAVEVRIDAPGFTGPSLRVTDCDDLDTDGEVLCPFVASE